MSNTTQKYPLSMMFFHGAIALLMIATLVIGWQLEDEGRSLMMLHKSLGVAVLLLVIVRLVNRFRVGKRVPSSVNARGSLQYFAEKVVHGLLYITMIGLPIMGWLTSNAFGHPAGFFGLFNLPTLIDKNEALAEKLGELHETGANLFFALLIVHLLGGLVHLVKEKHNIFKRMLPF